MDHTALILTLIGTGMGIVIGMGAIVITLFLWARGEASADRRNAADETKQLRRELIDCFRAIENEMKDFHGRLCAIEERRNK